MKEGAQFPHINKDLIGAQKSVIANKQAVVCCCKSPIRSKNDHNQKAIDQKRKEEFRQ